MALPSTDRGARWRQARTDSEVLHLDIAACGRSSTSVLDAQRRHLSLESERGGYVAEALAAPLIDSGRQAIAATLGVRPAGIGLVDSASVAFERLLRAWPLPPKPRIAFSAAEYPANVAAIKALAEVDVIDLPLDPSGRLDLDALASAVAGADLVALPHIASHSGLVHEVRSAVEICRGVGVPTVVDLAQSFGQVDVQAIEADAYVATSRKWLCGPRGVGVIAASDPTFVQGWESYEASVVARVGFATAVAELANDGESLGRIAALGAQARARLDGVGGWRVCEPLEEPSGMVTLSGGDAVEARERLLDAGILTTAIPVERAPRLLEAPLLRASFSIGSELEDIEQLAAALHAMG